MFSYIKILFIIALASLPLAACGTREADSPSPTLSPPVTAPPSEASPTTFPVTTETGQLGLEQQITEEIESIGIELPENPDYQTFKTEVLDSDSFASASPEGKQVIEGLLTRMEEAVAQLEPEDWDVYCADFITSPVDLEESYSEIIDCFQNFIDEDLASFCDIYEDWTEQRDTILGEGATLLWDVHTEWLGCSEAYITGLSTVLDISSLQTKCATDMQWAESDADTISDEVDSECLTEVINKCNVLVASYSALDDAPAILADYIAYDRADNDAIVAICSLLGMLTDTLEDFNLTEE